MSQNSLIFIGTIKKEACDGESMKNHALLHRFNEVYYRVLKFDTWGVKHHPWRFCKLGWYLIRYPKAKIAVSASTYIAYDVFRLLRRLGKKEVYYWVIGGVFPQLIEKNHYDPAVYRNLKGIFCESPRMVRDLEKYDIHNASYVPNFKHIEFDHDKFEVEATVMIPVRNRIRTIRDAINSVLKQKTNFKFNLMVVDNFSTDGTREAIAEYDDPRLIHIIADHYDMGIGGYWNLAAHHEKAGKFIVQLDSDDMYKDENTLQTMVNAFYEQNVAMVVGTYLMTDIDCNPIPPGVIDHKEWTPENGRNNALRINGLGAPRAFYTPVLREVMLPNVSYGEDYALGLNISRTYQIGRVYEPVYLCRRWDDNSDANADVVKMNNNNLYKDRIRTWELMARIAMNKKENCCCGCC